MFGNRGIYHKGWSAVTKHRTPWVMVGGDAAGVRRRRLGALRRQQRLHPGPRPRRRASRASCAKLQRLWLIEATKYNVLPLDDRTAERLNPDDRRAADADPRQLPAVLRRHGPAVGEQRRQHQEQVVLGHRRGRRPRRRRRGRDHRPGRPLRRLERSTPRTARLKFVYNVLGIHEFATDGRRADPGRHAPGADGVRLRRRRPGQGRRRHALLRRRRRSAPAGSRRPSR